MEHPLLTPGPTRVVGIVNVTPDSFSDGGQWFDHDRAIARGRELAAAGADLIDVGGESTRPGAARAQPAEELQRVLPVIRGLAADGIAVSVDTMRADTAVAAVRAGASVINDVAGGLADPDMLPAVAELKVPWICMHWRGHSELMTQRANYADVVGDVRDELANRLAAARRAGIDEHLIVLDPGLGFAKSAAHNWQLLTHLDALAELGRPLLIGASRKRFLGSLLADAAGERPPAERDAATAAITALLAARGVWGVRTHTVADQRDAVAVGAAWRAAAEPPRLGE